MFKIYDDGRTPKEEFYLVITAFFSGPQTLSLTCLVQTQKFPLEVDDRTTVDKTQKNKLPVNYIQSPDRH